jgi:IclR family transcriptional regulator, KDG regulon repressor
MNKSLLKTCQILEILTHKNEPIGVNEFSRLLGMPKSTVSRFLATLESLGFVRRNGENRKFRLGLKLFEWGRKALDDLGLRQVAIPLMEKLRDTVNEDVILSVLEDTHITYLEKVECSHHVVIHTAVGSTAPAHSVSSGKLMLAYDSRALEMVISNGLKAYTRYTIVNPNRLRQECAKVRDSGYAVSKEEFREGVTGVAAPIFNTKGTLVGAISISTPASRITERKRREHIKTVTQTARAISRQLGALTDGTDSA